MPLIAHAVYWNTTGSGTRYADSSNPIVRSEQLNYGYIIGTRATSGSAYHASNPTGGNTAPADHREGIGTSATHEPQSLYLDQFSRRVRPVITFATNGGSATNPASLQVSFGANYGPLPATSRPGFSFTGWFTATAGGELVTAESTVTNPADHPLFAGWKALPAVAAGPDQSLAGSPPLPWAPPKILTAAWFDAADPATLAADAGSVSLWQDKSGNQNHAAQATASRRPATGSATIGGLNAVAFDPFLPRMSPRPPSKAPSAMRKTSRSPPRGRWFQVPPRSPSPTPGPPPPPPPSPLPELTSSASPPATALGAGPMTS